MTPMIAGSVLKENACEAMENSLTRAEAAPGFFSRRSASCSRVSMAGDRKSEIENRKREVVRPPRFERGTSGLEIRCSIQLSYGRN